ncbi:hypothetical protein [Pseudoalteromonas luteoviolacea]|uniref:Uncharacterized protein n=1 Tax=Pseudoalteromonas luteoviolacea DSM 6061 TaxID=1365250 RepID=A0A166XUY6_9GAMM|nr:hypothetical protein [Pseudoalteromonas luteoviolacea]KZN40931.1 hypothetical protein N475_00725 [Pseudoalteromonas luteoviolacea DSM 6061]KZN56445.1 hypothetical protein N474_11910 [Pseudoalteromonas luteoviolacea CPMOR-2]MBE0386352.1 hypothetical protein [Pseudoalteromonas luteoviolacea DSM 6061]TQF71228.1 hypothetical protein FLM44_09090 [Pseudoalteromonas luteoviolacea]
MLNSDLQAKDAHKRAYQDANAEFAVHAMVLRHSPASVDNLAAYIRAAKKLMDICINDEDRLLIINLKLWFRRNLVLNHGRGSANLSFQAMCERELNVLDKYLVQVFVPFGSNIVPLLKKV